MAQTNFTPILTYKSDTASAVPSAGNLTNSANGAELAVNTADKRLFTKDSGGSVVELGTNPSSLTLPNGTANGVVYANGSKVLTTGSALTFNGSTLTVAPDANRALQIASAGTFSMLLQNNSADSGASIIYNTNGVHGFQIGGSEQMRLTSTGLGIGTSSPDTGSNTKLTVKGIYVDEGGNDAGYGWQIVSTTSGAAPLQLIAPAITFSTGANLARSVKATLDPSGNLGLGVTPSAWWSGSKAMQIGLGGYVQGRTGTAAAVEIGSNQFINGSIQRTYIQDGSAAYYEQSGGNHQWFTAPSGTAGNAISFSQVMTLDASGQLGIGATSPSSKLDVSGGATTTTIRVRQTAAGSASEVRFGDDAGTDGGLIIKGGSSYGSYGGANSFMFWNNRSGPVVFGTNDTERGRIDSGGNLLVGTTSAFGVGCTITNNGEYYAQANGQRSLSLRRNDNDGEVAAFFRAATQVGNISVTTSATAYNTSSDYRLKNITGPITTSGAYIDSLNPVEGTWKADGSTFVGLIAHEVQEASRTNVATGVKDGEEMQGMDYSSAEIIANLIAEVKALRTRVAALESI